MMVMAMTMVMVMATVVARTETAQPIRSRRPTYIQKSRIRATLSALRKNQTMKTCPFFEKRWGVTPPDLFGTDPGHKGFWGEGDITSDHIHCWLGWSLQLIMRYEAYLLYIIYIV